MCHCKEIIILYIFTVFSLTAASGLCKNGVNCILLNECATLNRHLMERNPYMLELLRRLQCGFGNNDQPMICCPDEFSLKYQDLSKESSSLLPDKSLCGIHPTDYIIAGNITELDEYPWLALLRYDKSDGNKGYDCGGALISSRYILTAAHCVKGAPAQKWMLSHVRLGDWNVTSDLDCRFDDCSSEAFDVSIEEAIPHELYDPNDGNQLNDIALLKLSRDIPFSDFVKPICLPSNLEREELFEPTDMEVAGWGHNGEKAVSVVKLRGNLKVIKEKDCTTAVNRTITDKHICGSSTEEHTCRSDSGGPLMSSYPSSSNRVVFGVLSYVSSQCRTPGSPNIYTRVLPYLDWIKSKIRK